MRVVALLALIFGFMAQFLLNGQVFTHAVFGVVCGVAALVCGLASACRDRPHRWEGRIMAGLGLALGLWCVVMLPSAYPRQQQFNRRREQRQKMHDQSRPAKITGANAAGPRQLPMRTRWAGRVAQFGAAGSVNGIDQGRSMAYGGTALGSAAAHLLGEARMARRNQPWPARGGARRTLWGAARASRERWS